MEISYFLKQKRLRDEHITHILKIEFVGFGVRLNVWQEQTDTKQNKNPNQKIYRGTL